jgi:hypothetical protein
MTKARGTGIAVRAGFAGLAALCGYVYWLRPAHMRWGATDVEVARAMSGDDLVRHPMHVTTRAVTIAADRAEVWPWLVQMGYRRAGMYSYDWVDRVMGILDEASTWRILPEFQHLALGDVIPMGSGPSWPVATVEAGRSLVLHIEAAGVDVTWSYLLERFHSGHTRLILRVRTWLAVTPQLVPLLLLMDPGEFLMVRKHLLGIKERAEALAAERHIL